MAKKNTPPLTPKELAGNTDALCDVLNNEPDLPRVLIVTSFLDQNLRTLLAGKLIESGITEKILDHRGVLGTFQARADMCYAMGLIGKGMYKNLCILGDIRNTFAHHHLVKDFSDPAITDLSKSLKQVRPNHVVGDPLPVVQDARSHFDFVAIRMSVELTLTAMGITHLAPCEDNWTLPFGENVGPDVARLSGARIHPPGKQPPTRAPTDAMPGTQ